MDCAIDRCSALICWHVGCNFVDRGLGLLYYALKVALRDRHFAFVLNIRQLSRQHILVLVQEFKPLHILPIVLPR